MQQLTREEWREVAERLGDSATGLEEVAEKHGAHVMDSSWQRLVDDLRLAVAAVLWVSENAADEIRFDVVDGQPTDEEHLDVYKVRHDGEVQNESI